MSSRKLAIAIILVVVLLSRIQLLWVPFFDVDETLFALFAKIWQHSGIPYVSCVETKALGVYVFYAFASWLVGASPNINMIAVHALSLVWTALTAGVVAVLARRLASPKAGFFAALFFVVFTSTYIPKVIATNIEVVLLLPLCLAVLAILRPLSSLRYGHSLLAGLAVSAAVLCKYQAGIMIPVILLYYWLCLWPMKPQWNGRRAVLHSLGFLLGGVPLPAVMLLYLYKMGGLQGFWFWNVNGSEFYIHSGSEALGWGYVLLTRVLPFMAASALLWILVGQRACYGREQRKAMGLEKCAQENLIWIWLVLGIIPVVMGRRFYPHYFLLLLPPASILAGLAADSRLLPSVRRLRQWRVGIVLGVMLPLVGFTLARYEMRAIYTRMGSADNLEVFRPYADYLKARTQPTDRILVWGFSPTIYWDADRLPATRFLTSGYLSGRVYGAREHSSAESPIMPGAWQMFFDDMAAHPAAYIMDMAPTGLDAYGDYPITRYPELMAYVRAHYVEEPSFQKASVYRRIGG